jgi:nitric oxide reductase large subunit
MCCCRPFAEVARIQYVILAFHNPHGGVVVYVFDNTNAGGNSAIGEAMYIASVLTGQKGQYLSAENIWRENQYRLAILAHLHCVVGWKHLIEFAGDRGSVDAVVIDQIKTNRYDPASDTLTLTYLQEAALKENRRFYDTLSDKANSEGPIRPKTIRDVKERQDLADFFFWTAWCSSTLRACKSSRSSGI